ncbi:tyrosine-type recombinase/integrase [Pseudarthrobacter sp. PvP090]|uniref:tyrosine-type recombinase/integrase n=1 Tax=Pseudarthrobacter sp. PvP090 TaxID=3156393 RepID=UPI003398B35B
MLFALLAATGLRVGEALALDRDSADLDAGVLLISRGKGRDPRLVPLHPTATAALDAMHTGAMTSATVGGQRSSPTQTANGGIRNCSR